MKIGFFTDSYLPHIDGVAIAVQTQMQELEKLGHEVYVIAPRFPNYKDRSNVIRLFSVKVYERPHVRLALQVPERSLLKILQMDFDIIHGHSGGPITFLGWQIAHLKKVPYIATYHTMWHRYAHYLFKGAIRPRMLEMTTVLFGNICDSLIAPTAKVEEELRSIGVKKPIYVIPSGLDLPKFANPKKGYLRRRYKIGPGDKILLSVCRLGREKSVDFLIKAFKYIYEADPSVYLILVGDGPERLKLEELVADLGLQDRVIFTGVIPNTIIPQVYADAELFLFASKTETQGMVILEAMVSGLPVIAVMDKAFKDIVKNNVNGFLVNKNLQVFAQRVVSLLENDVLVETLSTNARLTGKKYSVANTAVQLEKVYEELLVNYVADKSAWKDVMGALNSDFSQLLQHNYPISRISVNIREMDRIMSFLKNRFMR